MKLFYLWVLLIIGAQCKFRQKSHKVAKLANKYKKNENKAKIIKNEGMSIKDQAILHHTLPKKQPAPMSFKSLSGRIIMVKDNNGPVQADTTTTTPSSLFANGHGQVLDTTAYKSAQLNPPRLFDNSQELSQRQQNPYEFEKVQYSKGQEQQQRMRRVDSPVNPGLVPLSQLSPDEIKKAKQATFTVLDPYANKKLIQKNQRMAKQNGKDTPVPTPPPLATPQNPPAPLQTQMTQAQIQETQQLQAEMLKQQDNKNTLHQEGPSHPMQMHDQDYQIKSRLFNNVISAVNQGDTQIVQKLTNPTTIQVSQAKAHSVFSGVNNHPNIITQAIQHSPLFQTKDTASPTQQGLELTKKNQESLGQALLQLSASADNIDDVDSLLEFTYQLRRLQEDIEQEEQNMRAYMVSNYRLTLNLVNDIYELQQQSANADQKDYTLTQLNSKLNDGTKHKNQIHKIGSLQKLLKDSDGDESHLIDQMPTFIQNYCLLNSQVYRVSNVIRIQMDDTPAVAITKYLGQPQILFDRSTIHQDSLTYNYEVLQRQQNNEESSFSKQLGQQIKDNQAAMDYHSHLAKDRLTLRGKKRAGIKDQVQELIQHILHDDQKAMPVKSEPTLEDHAAPVVDEEEEYVDKQFQEKETPQQKDQVKNLLQELRLKAKAISNNKTLKDDLDNTINSFQNDQVDQATLFKQFILKHDKKKKKTLINKIDQMDKKKMKL